MKNPLTGAHISSQGALPPKGSILYYILVGEKIIPSLCFRETPLSHPHHGLLIIAEHIVPTAIAPIITTKVPR